MLRVQSIICSHFTANSGVRKNTTVLFYHHHYHRHQSLSSVIWLHCIEMLVKKIEKKIISATEPVHLHLQIEGTYYFFPLLVDTAIDIYRAAGYVMLLSPVPFYISTENWLQDCRFNHPLFSTFFHRMRQAWRSASGHKFHGLIEKISFQNEMNVYRFSVPRSSFFPSFLFYFR